MSKTTSALTWLHFRASGQVQAIDKLSKNGGFAIIRAARTKKGGSHMMTERRNTQLKLYSWETVNFGDKRWVLDLLVTTVEST